jgi:phospholipid/cholesterol/gamma-HCH transport system substrate-binding protein
VSFANLAGLEEHSPVRISGQRVGQVVNARVEHGRPMVDLQLDDGIELRPDTQVVIRSRSLLGARYVEVQPGTKGEPLPSGATLVAGKNASTVTAMEAIDAFNPPARRDLGSLVRGLGAGMAGRGADLNGLLAKSPEFFADLGATSQAVMDRSGAAARLVPSTESAASAADPVREDIADSFSAVDGALRPLAEQDADVKAALAEAPSALAAVDSNLHKTSPLLGATARLARNGLATVRALPPALRQTRGLLHSAPQPLNDAEGLLERVGPLVAPVGSISRNLTPILPRADRILADPLGVLRDLGNRRCDIAKFGSNWSSMLGYGLKDGKKVGPMTSLRLLLMEGGETVASYNDPKLLPLATNTYPKPCEAGTEKLR